MSNKVSMTNDQNVAKGPSGLRILIRRSGNAVLDFEHFLDTLPRPMRVVANFGVLVAYGGAASIEANNERYY